MAKMSNRGLQGAGKKAMADSAKDRNGPGNKNVVTGGSRRPNPTPQINGAMKKGKMSTGSVTGG